MELKNYQKQVIADLNRFLNLLTDGQNISKAYKDLWEEKGVPVGSAEGMPLYNSEMQGIPQVCFKVPTGGGKTFLAANAIKPIFDSMPNVHPKAVVWLVPSDAILTQTYNTLVDKTHDYRKKILHDALNTLSKKERDIVCLYRLSNPPKTLQEIGKIVNLSAERVRQLEKKAFLKIQRYVNSCVKSNLN